MEKYLASRVTVRDWNVGMLMQVVAVGNVYFMLGDSVSLVTFLGMMLSIWAIGLCLVVRSQRTSS